MINPFDDPTVQKKRTGFGKIFLAALAAFLLIQYSVVERVIGRYLSLHNAERPLAGQAWTSGVEKEMAAGRSEVPELTSGIRNDLAQWFLRAERGRPTTLPLQRFASLWMSVPGYLGEGAIENEEWQKLVLNSEVDRVRPTSSKRGIELTFLTSTNKPVSRVMIKKDIVTRLMQHGQVLNDSITKTSVEMRLLPGNEFEARFVKMPSAERKQLWGMLNNDILIHRPILRYGFSHLDDDYSVLWIEFQSPSILTESFVLPNAFAQMLGSAG